MAPATERVFVAAPMSDFGRGVLAGPIQFFVSGEDNLRVESINSLTGVIVEIHGRTWRSDTKTIDPFRFTHTPATNRTVTRQDFPLAVGAILNLTVFASAGAPRIGQTFVRVQLIRGLVGATIVLGTLLQGYVTGSQDLGWPGSPIQSSVDGGGVVRCIIGTDPPAGTDWSETVPTGARWEVLSAWARLVTDATVANRIVFLRLDDVIGAMQTIAPNYTQTGTMARTYMFVNAIARDGTPVSDLVQVGLGQTSAILAGGTIHSNTSGLQAGDNWDAPRLVVREWLEGN